MFNKIYTVGSDCKREVVDCKGSYSEQELEVEDYLL